jgi:hypothetical protein
MSRRIFRITAAFGKIFGIMGGYLKASTSFMKMALRKKSRISYRNKQKLYGFFLLPGHLGGFIERCS